MNRAEPVLVLDRSSRRLVQEPVWGGWWLDLLYGESFLSKSMGRFLLHSLVRWPFLSWLFGTYYDSRRSRELIEPFCAQFHVDSSEFLDPLTHFKSFNDFFTRRLRPECRLQDPDPSVVTIPADGRYSFLTLDGRPVPCKGERLSLEKLLGCSKMAAYFHGGTAVLCRLCPADCHRFYFSMDGHAGEASWIQGSLFSVNPVATSQYPWIFWTNRRICTIVTHDRMGKIAYVEIGATNCGSIIEEFPANSYVRKGQEKGFFRLGGSAIILLFEPGQIRIVPDLLALSASGHEVVCRIGQPLGVCSV